MDNQPLPNVSGPSDRSTQALQDASQFVADLTHSVDRLTDSVTDQTRAEGELTRDQVQALRDKVHVLSNTVKLLALVAVLLGLGLAFVIWNQQLNGGVVRDTQATLNQTNDCIDPAGRCYRQRDDEVDAKIGYVIAQLECNLGGYCPPGMAPQHPITVTTSTTVPVS